MFAMQKMQYRLFRWKNDMSMEHFFSLANDPAWSFHKGPWMDDFYQCFKEYSEECAGGYEDVTKGCTSQGYLYMRSLFPALPIQLWTLWKKWLKSETFFCIVSLVVFFFLLIKPLRKNRNLYNLYLSFFLKTQYLWKSKKQWVQSPVKWWVMRMKTVLKRWIMKRTSGLPLKRYWWNPDRNY